MTVIGGFQSNLSITCKTDRNFGNVSAGVLFSKVAYQCKTVVNLLQSAAKSQRKYCCALLLFVDLKQVVAAVQHPSVQNINRWLQQSQFAKT